MVANKNVTKLCLHGIFYRLIETANKACDYSRQRPPLTLLRINSQEYCKLARQMYTKVTQSEISLNS
jgi:hypothetical protein